jgi:glycosyltransferase involved in cell wall biosynthesis
MSDKNGMRIAFLTHQWPGARMGGIGSAVRQAAGAMAAAGHDVHVFTLGIPADLRASVPAGVALHEVCDLAGRVQNGTVPGALAAMVHAGGDGVYRLAIASLLCAELLTVHLQKPFDLVEAPEVEALGLPLLLNPDFDAPVVTHLHCCTAIAQKANHVGGSEDSSVLPALEFAAIHLADAVYAPTQAVVNATREFCAIQGDVRIIPHGFATESKVFQPPSQSGPILFVGRLERLKGVRTLIDALNLFLPRHSNAVFRFIGPDTSTGPGGTSMRAWLESRLLPTVRARVQFSGELPPEQITREWEHTRFGVMPSLWENFSMACCEAMAAGRTVVVADGTGSIEVLGDSGLISDRESAESLCAAIEKLWLDDRELQKLSRAAFDRITTTFVPGRIAALREWFYREAIANFAAGGRDRTRRKLLSLPPACAAAVLPALVRMTGAMAGVTSQFQTPGTRLLQVMESLDAPAEILLYGAGKHTARLMSERHLWESRRHRVVGIIDDHPQFALSPVYLDLPVQSLGSAKARVLAGEALPTVVLSTDTYEDQFWKQSAPLREAGVRVLRLYS